MNKNLERKITDKNLERKITSTLSQTFYDPPLSLPFKPSSVPSTTTTSTTTTATTTYLLKLMSQSADVQV